MRGGSDGEESRLQHPLRVLQLVDDVIRQHLRNPGLLARLHLHALDLEGALTDSHQEEVASPRGALVARRTPEDLRVRIDRNDDEPFEFALDGGDAR